MYISIDTVNVWEFDETFTASQLFQALPLISAPTDILVIGSYRLADAVRDWLTAHEIALPYKRPFFDSFDMNRGEYPDGRFYALNPDQDQIGGLVSLCGIPRGGVDKDLFFDHLLLYRPGVPVIPLLNFHDAFNGGVPYLSGHYASESVRLFAAALEAPSRMVDNPEMK